jgi:pimeloyl-ACP methyl ester carboxylesterase
VAVTGDQDPRRVTLPDGRILAVSEFGDPAGYPILWCHGGLSSRTDIELAGDGIAELGIRLVTVDRPGIGESTRQKGRRVTDWPVDVAAVADAFGIDRFAVSGWSAGGPFALACAAALPDRVVAVATIGGMAPIRSRADRRELGLALDRLFIPMSRRAPWLVEGVLQVVRRSKPARIKQRMLKTLPEPDQVILSPLSPDAAVGATLSALRHGTGGTVDDYRAFGGDWGFDLQHVNVPMRCWQGDRDTLLPMAHAQRLVASLRHGDLRVVPDAGHFLFASHAAEVFGTLLADARASG